MILLSAGMTVWPIYEYAQPEIGYSQWGSCNFDYYKGVVKSFLQSAADYWLTVFHGDGLRMDAISHAIYWQGQENRGINVGGVEFLRGMNKGLHERHPSAVLIAEDSSNYLKVTALWNMTAWVSITNGIWAG